MAEVIKSGRFGDRSGTSSATAFNLEDIRLRGGAMLEAARREGERLKEQARAECDAIREAARIEGQKQAIHDARRQLQAENQRQLAQSLQALQQVVALVDQLRLEWSREWENRLIQLAAALAERIVRRRLDESPELSEQWVRETLELATGCGHLRIHLHPQDLETLGDVARQLAHQLNRTADVEVTADASIEPGGCRVTTEYGSIDMQLTSQIARLREELTL